MREHGWRCTCLWIGPCGYSVTDKINDQEQRQAYTQYTSLQSKPTVQRDYRRA